MEKEGQSDLARAYQSTPEKKVGGPVAPSLGPLSPITPFPKHVLVQAAKVGIKEHVKQLLDDKSLEKSNDQMGWALMCAVQFGRSEATKMLILAGAPLAAKMQFEDGRKYHTIMMACKYGHPKCVEIVLDLGRTDPNEADEKGMSALMVACQRGHLECVQLLLDRGANIEAADMYGVRALHFAARGGRNASVVQALCERGADTNATDESGSTPLIVCGQYNDNPKIAEILIKHDAVIDQEDLMGLSALAYASKHEHRSVLDTMRSLLGISRTDQKLADTTSKADALKSELDIALLNVEQRDKEIRALRREINGLKIRLREEEKKNDSLRSELRESNIIIGSLKGEHRKQKK